MAQAQQQEGWPLGLRPLNSRVGLVRNPDNSGSISFSTMLTGSPSSSTASSSSDLDTESTVSFFHDKSITLGSLIGISSILEISRRSTRGIRTAETSSRNNKKIFKAKPWLFSLCSKLSTDAVNNMNPATTSTTTTTTTPLSLGHFLRQERRATTATTATTTTTSSVICRGDVQKSTFGFSPAASAGSSCSTVEFLL